MLHEYSYLYRNHHFYNKDNSYSFIMRCIDTKIQSGISRNYAYTICKREYTYKKQDKDIKINENIKNAS